MKARMSQAPLSAAMRLGVNVDHVATLRQARGTVYPDPVEAGRIALAAGATSITVHLREDRSEEHTSELQSLMRISYAVFCLQKKRQRTTYHHYRTHRTMSRVST